MLTTVIGSGGLESIVKPQEGEESLIDRYLRVFDETKQAAADLKDLKANKEELESQLIEEFVSKGEQGRKLKNGRNVSIMRKVCASPQAGKQEEMIQIIKDHGFGDVVKETIAPQTLSSLIKEQEIEAGSGEFPEWVTRTFNVFEKFTLSVRKH